MNVAVATVLIQMVAPVTASIQSVPVAPPAPPRPPEIIMSPPAQSRYFSPDRLRSAQRSMIDVTVSVGKDIHWSGSMTVSGNQSASFNRRLSEAAPEDCPPNGFGQSVQNSLSVQINSQRSMEGDADFGIAVNWGRSLPGTCPLRNSSREVGLNETVRLTPGQSITLSGDGNLTVHLHRR